MRDFGRALTYRTHMEVIGDESFKEERETSYRFG